MAAPDDGVVTTLSIEDWRWVGPWGAGVARESRRKEHNGHLGFATENLENRFF